MFLAKIVQNIEQNAKVHLCIRAKNPRYKIVTLSRIYYYYIVLRLILNNYF